MNGITYLWNFGDGTTSTEINPVHTYTEEGSYTVTLSVDGGVCGSGSITKEHFIIIDASMVCPVNMTSGTLNKEGCTGVVYDAGGANGNYPPNVTSTLIIHSSGAEKIVLTVEEFDIESGSGSTCNYDYIEFHDGNSINAPLINNTRYCNTTGNPETISSTGEYITIRFHSDEGVELSGYKIFFRCQGFPTPPKAHFSTNTKVSCTGIVEFIDNSLNKPVEWLWNFGDGNTSAEPNPIHQYAQTGIYTVSLTVTNEYGTSSIQKDNLITVTIPDAPEVGDIKGCNNFDFEINLNLEGTAYWYENITDTEPVYIGNIWNHPPIEENITYFLREVTQAPAGSIDEYCISPFTDVLLISETCLSVSQYHLEKIVISPNPSNGLFNIKGLTEGMEYRYVITDITGRIIVANQPLTCNVIDIGRFPNGIYFMTLSTPESVKTYQLVKVK